ncbi:unnamed protein product [Spodoptera exigua]|nr:unnamed protein product [Spodoptera exigua]
MRHRDLGLEQEKEQRDTPFGQMPVIEFNGKQYAQSIAIARYLGNKYGLAGETLEDKLEIDQNVYLINDLRTKAASANYEKDEVIKEQKYKEFSEGVFPDSLERINALIIKNNGYIALGKVVDRVYSLPSVKAYANAVSA